MEDQYDTDDLLRRTYALAKENNKLLKKLRHGTSFALIYKLLFWAVMLGLPVWLYFNYLQPIVGQSMQMLQQVQDLTGGVTQTNQKINNQSQDVQKLLDSINQLPGAGLLKNLSQ